MELYLHSPIRLHDAVLKHKGKQIIIFTLLYQYSRVTYNAVKTSRKIKVKN